MGSLRGGTSPCCRGILPPIRVRGHTSSRPELCAGFQSHVLGAVGLGLRLFLSQRVEAGAGEGLSPAPRGCLHLSRGPCLLSVSPGGCEDPLPARSRRRPRRRVPYPAAPPCGQRGFGGALGTVTRRLGVPHGSAMPGGAEGQRSLSPVLRRAPRDSAASPRPLLGLGKPRTARPSANKPTPAPRLKQGTPPGVLFGELGGYVITRRGARTNVPEHGPGGRLAVPAPWRGRPPGLPPQPF